MGVAGTTDPVALAALADPRLRATPATLRAALTGTLGAHQRFLLGQLLAHVDELGAHITALDAEIAKRLDPERARITLLDTIPGIDHRTAEVILAEIGVDLTRFPDADHLAAWAGLAPGQNESGGKRRRARTRRGNPALRAALILAAWAASHTKTTFLGALYRRWVRRMPANKAITALAHRLLIIVYHVVVSGQPYQELGPTYHDERDRTRIVHQTVRRLARLGFRVTLEPDGPLPATG